MSASSAASNVRVTVDTNVIISGLLVSGRPPYHLVQAWLDGAFRLVTSPALQAEVIDVLSRPKFAKYGLNVERVAAVIDALFAAEQAVSLVVLPVAMRDTKDVKVLACALGGQVDYLVTGDSDLAVLRDEPELGGLRIVTVREFLAALRISAEDGQRP